MKNFFIYQIYFILNLLVLKLFIGFLITYFIGGSYLYVIMCSLVIAMDLDDMIDRQRNFDRYYPHFSDKWLYF
jgi:hypothetical protein